MKPVLIMGILNLTPDSFSDGGLYFGDVEIAVKRVRMMVKEGADIIDVGGESTRPGSEGVSADEEISRVVPIITAVKKLFGEKITISIDTNKASVAEAALQQGVTIVNSLGGTTFDSNLLKVVKKYQAQFVIYHIHGIPKTMQVGDAYADDIMQEITTFFTEQIALGEKHGIDRAQFILDPGIGFGKTVTQNLEIIRRIHEFKHLSCPILIGVSRKSHLGALLQEKLAIKTDEMERLEASLAETAIAIQQGASIIRTHDVLQTKKFVTVLEELL